LARFRFASHFSQLLLVRLLRRYTEFKLAYSKTLSSDDNIAFVEISGWEDPGVAFSSSKIESLLNQLSVIGDDMISSKEGKAGEALYFIESELHALLRSSKNMKSGE